MAWTKIKKYLFREPGAGVKNFAVFGERLSVDVHSHILPGIDDGVNDFSESIEIIRVLKMLGYRKLILTPHIRLDFYENTNESVSDEFKNFEKKLKESDLEMDIAVAAEYFFDNYFVEKVKTGDLLNFGNRFVLFETSLLYKPAFLHESIFSIISKGYKPVMAHPERYLYLQESPSEYERLKEYGVLFQVNVLSLTGDCHKNTAKAALRLVEQGMVDFVGTDLHQKTQTDIMSATKNLHCFDQLFEKNNVLNATLLN